MGSFKTALFAALLFALLAVPTSASAGLKSRGTKTAKTSLSGSTLCTGQTVTAVKSIRLPRGAVGVRYAGPATSEVLELEDLDGVTVEGLQATVVSAHGQRFGSRFKTEVKLSIVGAGSCSSATPIEWKTSFETGASFRMRAKDRFKGFMAGYNGKRQSTSVTGDYHSLEFRDRLGLRTRYKVCARGIFGNKCWRRSTDSDGIGSIEASIAMNDRIGSGTLRWYVDGRVVARFVYRIGPEGV